MEHKDYSVKFTGYADVKVKDHMKPATLSAKIEVTNPDIDRMMLIVNIKKSKDNCYLDQFTFHLKKNDIRFLSSVIKSIGESKYCGMIFSTVLEVTVVAGKGGFEIIDNMCSFKSNVTFCGYGADSIVMKFFVTDANRKNDDINNNIKKLDHMSVTLNGDTIRCINNYIISFLSYSWDY